MEDRNRTGWKPVGGNIMTRWADDIDPHNVLPEYPRPQMVRSDWLNLNGLWDYAIQARDAERPSAFNGRILVPFPPESALSGVKKPLTPDRKLWYRRFFSTPDTWQGKRLLLHFGAVDWKAEVWINDKKAGEHTGGYYPFTLDITELAEKGGNELLVAVWDPTDSRGHERGKQKLAPGGLFYAPVSGIWQTVWLEPVPESFISSFRLTPDIDHDKLTIEIETAGNSTDISLEARTYKGTYEDKHEGKGAIAGEKGPCGRPLELKIPQPKLWSPDSPYLYDVVIRLVDGEGLVDEVKSYFGMRKFGVGEDSQGKKRLFLNNKPLFQNGVLDQGYWPDGLYTAPTDVALRYDLEMTKKLGFNMTRKHIKVEPARWYYHCDRIGLIVWQDMVSGGEYMKFFQHMLIPNLFRSITLKDNKYHLFGRQDKAGRDNFRKELKEMIDALYNVPSIGMWVPFNEAWGQFDAAETAAWIKEYDPTRWVDHASGWYDQGAGDVQSIHTYFRKLSMPKRRDHRPVVISEYGGYSHAERGHLWDEKRAFGYRGYKSRESLKKAYESLLHNQLGPLVPKGISAAVYTQLTDVETETNGLITYDREVVKIDPETMRNIV